MRRISGVALFTMIAPALAGGQPYQGTKFSEIFAKWDKATAKERPGLTIMPLEKLRFSARYTAAPTDCPTGLFDEAMTMLGNADFLKRAPTHHCIEVEAEGGRKAQIYVQDMLVPGLQKDAKVGGRLDIHALLVGYEVQQDRARNQPVMEMTEFEPE